MQKVIAFKCGFCNKLFHHSKSYATHQDCCSMNPNLKGCETCAFWHREPSPLDTKQLGYHACLVNIEILRSGVKTNCSKYMNRIYKEDTELMAQINEKYDYDSQRRIAKDLGYLDDWMYLEDTFDDGTGFELF